MNTRKVLFRELPYQFYPEEDEEIEEKMKEKEGLFHTWIVEEELSPESEQYVQVTKALIEKENGKMIAVDYSLITFIK